MDDRRTQHSSRLKLCLLALAVVVVGGCNSADRGSKQSKSTEAVTGHEVVIFDGKTLNGWAKRGGDAQYRVENGAIVGETRPDQPNTFLCTVREYSNFRLDLEFKIDTELNSGIQIRSHARPEDGRERVFGYQVEIDPSDRAWTAGFYDEARRGWLASPSAEAMTVFKQNDWNHLTVEAQGTQIRTWLNGVPATTLHDSMDASGFIGLQVHGVGSRADPLHVSWRNIQMWELNAH